MLLSTLQLKNFLIDFEGLEYRYDTIMKVYWKEDTSTFSEFYPVFRKLDPEEIRTRIREEDSFIEMNFTKEKGYKVVFTYKDGIMHKTYIDSPYEIRETENFRVFFCDTKTKIEYIKPKILSGDLPFVIDSCTILQDIDIIPDIYEIYGIGLCIDYRKSEKNSRISFYKIYDSTLHLFEEVSYKKGQPIKSAYYDDNKDTICKIKNGFVTKITEREGLRVLSERKIIKPSRGCIG